MRAFAMLLLGTLTLASCGQWRFAQATNLTQTVLPSAPNPLPAVFPTSAPTPLNKTSFSTSAPVNNGTPPPSSSPTMASAPLPSLFPTYTPTPPINMTKIPTFAPIKPPSPPPPTSSPTMARTSLPTQNITGHINGTDDDPLLIKPAELTTLGEGNDAATNFIHCPRTKNSGVTVGKGYDIGSRDKQQVIKDLTEAGMTKEQAEQISEGAGLRGPPAQNFVKQNRDKIGTIPNDVQYALLAKMLLEYKEKAKKAATSTMAVYDNDGNGVNAKAREEVDEKTGAYVLTEDEWNALHPAMVEFLTDLIYQGGYYGYDRIARINLILKANHGNQLAQFEGVKNLFESQRRRQLSYMDQYAKRLGEKTGNKETFYGQTEEDLVGATTRRNRIRLAYLKQIIKAMKAGKAVKLSTVVQMR